MRDINCSFIIADVNKTDGREKCTKDDLRNGLQFIMDHMEVSLIR